MSVELVTTSHGLRMVLFFENLLFTLLVPGTVAVYVPLWIARDRPTPAGLPFVLGSAVLTAGAVLYGWCVFGFAVRGRGTPAPVDAPKSLVVWGPYQFCRNPMYVGVLTVILVWSVIFESGVLMLYALVVAMSFHLVVVMYEEPCLRRRFGTDYDDYCRRVGRWLPGGRPGSFPTAR